MSEGQSENPTAQETLRCKSTENILIMNYTLGFNIVKSPTADTDPIEPDIAGAGVDLN